jgi:uncharacterized protein with PQ loop repeat
MKILKKFNTGQIFMLALILILINAATWLIFAVLVAVKAFPMDSIPTALRWILTTLAVIAAGVLLVLHALLRRHIRVAYYLALVVLAGLVLLTFIDQVGITDLIYALIALTPLVLLIVCRRWYFQKWGQ